MVRKEATCSPAPSVLGAVGAPHFLGVARKALEECVSVWCRPATHLQDERDDGVEFVVDGVVIVAFLISDVATAGILAERVAGTATLLDSKDESTIVGLRVAEGDDVADGSRRLAGA